MRDNRLTQADRIALNARLNPAFIPESGSGYIRLTTHNASADSYNDDRMRSLATKPYTFKATIKGTRKMLATPGFLPPKTTQTGYSHSITMMFFNVVLVLKKVINDPELDVQLAESLRILKDKLISEEYKTILESVDEDGHLVDTIAGRVINPGHCIETAWFLIDAAPMRDKISSPHRRRP